MKDEGMAEQNKPGRFCRNCGKPVESDGDDDCPRCRIDRAERYIEQAAGDTPRPTRLRGTTAWKALMGAVVLLCAGVVLYQSPRILAVFKAPKPVRMGTYATDADTDRCLKNLWQIVHDLQQGVPGAGRTLVCPASGNPYVILPGSNPEIHCPNPGLHGFRDIVASKRAPVQELKRQ
jgi:hypothetical protein